MTDQRHDPAPYPDTTRPARYEPCPAHTDEFGPDCVACVWSTVLGLVHHVNLLRDALDDLKVFGTTHDRITDLAADIDGLRRQLTSTQHAVGA